MPTRYRRIVSSISSAVAFARLYSESIARIDVLTRRVQEGRDIVAASEFCRWLTFSGIFDLLKTQANEERGILKIDGAHLEYRCHELLSLCNDRMSHNSTEPCLTAGYLQSLHDKIETMAGYLSKLSVETPVITQSVPAVVEPSREPREAVPCPVPARSAGQAGRPLA